jgi:hypothetical protein
MAAGWPSRRLAGRRPVLMPGTWRGGARRRWRDPRPLRHRSRPGISRHKQGARGLPAERHAAAGAPNPLHSQHAAGQRQDHRIRTHPDTAITAGPALAYCQGRALPSRYETLPEMASAVQGIETIPYRRIGAPRWLRICRSRLTQNASICASPELAEPRFPPRPAQVPELAGNPVSGAAPRTARPGDYVRLRGAHPPNPARHCRPPAR